MANYEHTTRLQLKEKIYQRLGEDGEFWPTAELNQNIDEALLTFGAISGFWKDTVQLVTEENKRVYDLFTDVTVGNAFIQPLLPYQVIIDWINKDLLENISIGNPESEFLSLDTLIKAIEVKYNLYQQLTNLVVTKDEFIVTAQQNKVDLPENFIDLIRASFVEEDFTETILDQADEAEIQYFASEYITKESIPKFYANVYGTTKELTLYPINSVTGILKLLSINGVDDTIPPIPNSVIYLPNNLVPYIKYGVLADIYNKDGVLNDVARAAYCKQRWEEGIIIGRNYTSALLAKANNNIIEIDSVNNIDIWSIEKKVRYPPRICGFAGFNIFVIDTIPSADLASLEFLVNSNAKLPANDNDFIKIDKEYMDAFTGYIIHLCMQKSGIAEIATTSNLKDDFIKMALNHNQRLKYKGITFDTLMGITKKQEKEQKRIPEEANT